MDFSVWIAIGLYVGVNGQVQVDHYPQPFKTQEECMDGAVKDRLAMILGTPEVIAYVIECREFKVIVKDEALKPSAPEAPAPKAKAQPCTAGSRVDRDCERSI